MLAKLTLRRDRVGTIAFARPNSPVSFVYVKRAAQFTRTGAGHHNCFGLGRKIAALGSKRTKKSESFSG